MQLGFKTTCKKYHILVPMSRGKQYVFENEFISDLWKEFIWCFHIAIKGVIAQCHNTFWPLSPVNGKHIRKQMIIMKA